MDGERERERERDAVDSEYAVDVVVVAAIAAAPGFKGYRTCVSFPIDPRCFSDSSNGAIFSIAPSALPMHFLMIEQNPLAIKAILAVASCRCS